MPLQDSYPMLMEQANSLRDEERYDEAVEIYRRIVKRLNRLSSETLEKREDLRAIFRSASTATVTLSRLTGNVDILFEITDILKETQPQGAYDLTILRAQGLSDADRTDEAIELLRETASRQDATPDLRLELVVEALWNERPEDALAIMEPIDVEALTEEEDRDLIPDTWFLRFRALAKLGRTEEAERAWQLAKETSTADPPTSMEIVEMFIRHEDLDKALHYADVEANLSLRGYLRGLVAEMSGKHDWAIDEWWRVTREAFDVEDDGYPAWLECALRQADTDKAGAAIAAGLEKYPNSPRILLYQAVKLAKEGELDSASNMMTWVAQMNVLGRIDRQHFIFDTDRWLIEQSLADPDAQEAMLDALFNASDSANTEESDSTESADGENGDGA